MAQLTPRKEIVSSQGKKRMLLFRYWAKQTPFGLTAAYMALSVACASTDLSKEWSSLLPLDPELRVVLEFPENMAEQDPAFWCIFRSDNPDQLFFYGDKAGIFMPKSMTTSEDLSRLPKPPIPLSLRVAEAFPQRLQGPIVRLLPQTSLGKTPDDEYLRLKADFTTTYLGDFEGQQKSARGLELRTRVVAIDSEGKIIASVEGAGIQYLKKSRWETPDSLWGEAAGLALQDSLHQLISSLRQDESLKLFLRERAERRAQPAGMVATVLFEDSDGLLENGYLDAGEEARLKIRVANQGPGSAYRVAVSVSTDTAEVEALSIGNVGDIPPGQEKDIEVRVRGSLELGSGGVKVRIDTNEKRGYGARPLVLEVATRPLIRPQLEVVDVTLNDRTGPAHGDGDGRPANGETLETIIRVRNSGPGEAVGVVVTASPNFGAVEAPGPSVTIPRIASGSSEEARLLIRVPVALDANELALRFDLVEARGPQVASTTKEQSWKLQIKRPDIELVPRLYDGNSSDSAGNRDGLVNNGERVEVAITPTNRGHLPARGVRIAIESANPTLVPRPAAFEIGEIPAGAEAPPQRFAFDVPRAFGRDRPVGDFRFAFNITQQDFPSRREPIAFTFRALRPEMTLDADIPLTLARGRRAEMVLRFRNAGALAAEDLEIEVISEAEGVDLLTERNVPSRTHKVVLGNLGPQSGFAEARVGINLRRSAALGTAPFRVRVTQKDFPTLEQGLSLAVTEEPAAAVMAEPLAEAVPAAVALRAPTAPATISFLSNTPGQHLITEAMALRFEVQATADLAEIRATQNERPVPLESARRGVSGGGGWIAVQYEIPILLDEGENLFEIVAVTREGLRSSRSLTLYRDHEVGRIWVVAIGVGRYQREAIRGLDYADEDARAVFDYFRDTFQLPADQLFLRIDEQATLREIKSTLGTQLMKRATDPRDTVIIYFAGHGMRDRVAGSLDPDGLSKYLLPYDAHPDDLYSTALEMEEVTNILRRLVPERVVVLLDSCFSGAAGGRSLFDPRASAERALISDEFLDRMARGGKGRVVLTASGPNESAQEDADLGHGVFTYYLVQGLRGAADGDGDGAIDVHEVYRYLSEKVAKATGGKQNPQIKEPDLVGQILIGRGAVRRPR